MHYTAYSLYTQIDWQLRNGSGAKNICYNKNNKKIFSKTVGYCNDYLNGSLGTIIVFIRYVKTIRSHNLLIVCNMKNGYLPPRISSGSNW